MRLCDKHIPAEMSIGTFRQKCTNPRNVTIHCYICVRNVTIGHFCTEYDCHITPQNSKIIIGHPKNIERVTYVHTKI